MTEPQEEEGSYLRGILAHFALYETWCLWFVDMLDQDFIGMKETFRGLIPSQHFRINRRTFRTHTRPYVYRDPQHNAHASEVRKPPGTR